MYLAKVQWMDPSTHDPIKIESNGNSNIIIETVNHSDAEAHCPLIDLPICIILLHCATSRTFIYLFNYLFFFDMKLLPYNIFWNLQNI